MKNELRFYHDLSDMTDSIDFWKTGHCGVTTAATNFGREVPSIMIMQKQDSMIKMCVLYHCHALSVYLIPMLVLRLIM